MDIWRNITVLAVLKLSPSLHFQLSTPVISNVVAVTQVGLNNFLRRSHTVFFFDLKTLFYAREVACNNTERYHLVVCFASDRRFAIEMRP